MADVIEPARAPDEAQPTGPEVDQEIFPRLKEWTKSSLDHLSEWRKEAEAAQEFYAGHQWSDDEKRLFEDDGRIAPIFNLTAVNIDVVCGLEVNNRQDVKYLPRTEGDVQVNELLSSAAMWVRDQAQAEDEESNAFRDAVITGLGVTETRTANRLISVDRRDPTECFYDKSSSKTNLVDRRFGGRVIMMDTDEAVAFFGDRYTAFEINAKWASFGLNQSKKGEERLDYPTEQMGPTDNSDTIPKKVCVVEIEWFDWVGTEKVYYQAFLGASSILEQNPLKEWAYNWITGKYDAKKRRWYGLIRAFKDPQKFINKMISVGTHILASNAKGGLLYERGVFVDQRAAERDWSNPQKNVEVAEGALASGRIQPRTAPAFPAAISQLLDFALAIFNRVTGINAEILGTTDRDQPASLEAQRRQSAVTILATLFDSKRRYHKEQGKTLLQLMKGLPPETLVRITVDEPPQMPMPPVPPGTPPDQQIAMMEQYAQAMGQQQQQAQQERYVRLALIQQAFADDTIEFDVIVDEAPSSPNQQQEVIAKIAMMAQHGMQLPPQAQAIVVKSIGLPATIADEIAQAMTGSDPQVEQLQQQLQQGAQILQQAQAENEQLKTDRSIDQQKAQTDQFKAQTDRMKAQADIVAQTGGVPVLDYLAALESKVDQIGSAVLHMQQP
ncbi:hypothetical protein SAMN02927924_01425 [Sphingobium faniae]|nr:hypothetical protein SAMN02927924_01425 [Sphingobium faniae]